MIGIGSKVGWISQIGSLEGRAREISTKRVWASLPKTLLSYAAVRVGEIQERRVCGKEGQILFVEIFWALPSSDPICDIQPTFDPVTPEILLIVNRYRVAASDATRPSCFSERKQWFFLVFRNIFEEMTTWASPSTVSDFLVVCCFTSLQDFLVLAVYYAFQVLHAFV